MQDFLFTVTLHRHIRKLQSWIFFFDAAGLGLFTVMGVQVGLNAEMGMGNSIVLGTITGCFGGVFRDILSGVRPLIFRKEIYATASIMGGLIYAGLLIPFNEGILIQLTAIVCTTGIMFAA